MDLKKDALDVYHKNRRIENGYQYTVPSPSTYPYQWLWDSCFHAIVLAQFEPEEAVKELRSLVSKQFWDGMIPHIIFWDPRITRPYNVGWGVDGTSSITQPPMIAYAVWEIYRRTNDMSVLKEFYPALLGFYHYLIEKRDPRDHHLIGIINPDESGEDNSPRFDKPMHVPTDISFLRHIYERHKLVDANRACDFDAETCMKKVFWAKDVPFNAILVKNLRILAHIASLLGEEQGEHFATLHAGLVKEAMRERLFDENEGIYWSAAGPDYDLLKVATWAHFVPLFADLYTKEEADALIHNHFYNEDTFHSSRGIRTVSKKEPSYRPDGFWRGPIWFAPHWFIHKGLLAYGYRQEADWLTDSTVGLIQKNGFREYFDPETGEAHGTHQFTWGALVLDMMDS